MLKSLLSFRLLLFVMIISSEVILLLEYQFLERVYTKAFVRESSYWKSCKSTFYRVLFFLTIPKYYVIARIKTKKIKNNILQCHINFPFCSYTFWSQICVNSRFFKQPFYKQHKNQANAKQHPETELLLFGNYSHSSST